jgi:hypothetical protein
MSVLAEALIEKRRDVTPYIDTTAQFTDSMSKESVGLSGIRMLTEECQSKIPGETKLIFLTADAGHGKTALLRRLTRQFATQYREGKSDSLLFHIDTQGRSFVRLEEAIARDLGQLRIFGLFYPGVIRLVRHGLLTLAIDGFDELLAEIGVNEAYSGLGSLLRQLKGDGMLIASARSAYFEVENYAAQTKLLTASPDTHVSVSQMRLDRWQRPQTVDFFRQYRDESGLRIEEPEALYDHLAQSLTPEHPVLHRPFLVQRLAMLLAPNIALADELAADIGQPSLRVVPQVIQALLKREVEEKWRDPTGQPYLTVAQHVILLCAIADEMWSQGKNSLSVETVQLVAEAVVDDLKVPTATRVQIIQRVNAHALLPISNGELSFDHEEFLNVFLATQLSILLKKKERFSLQRFCEVHPIPDTICSWAVHLEPWDLGEARSLIKWLSGICKDEVRSSYLRQNIGKLSGVISRVIPGGTSNLTFSWMFFDGNCWKCAELSECVFQHCMFLNADLSGTKYSHCRFEECQIDGLIIDDETLLEGSSFDTGSQVVGVLKRPRDGEASLKNYVPNECRHILEQVGARFDTPVEVQKKVPPVRPQLRGVLDAFLRIFAKNTGVNEDVARTKLGSRYGTFDHEILPCLRKFDVVRLALYSGGGQQERWELNYPIESILKAEDPRSNAPSNLRAFWEKLRAS